jgi:hypothetical protein
MYQPYNIAVLMTFYSPLIITILILSMSFIFQNLKGIGFLIWLLVFSWLRQLIYELTGSQPMQMTNTARNLCEMVQYSKYGNTTFSSFFISFSLVYLCAAMFINRQVNYWLFSAFLFYFFVDVFIRYSSGCFMGLSGVFMDTVYGLTCGILSVMTMYLIKCQNQLFFNEISSGKDVCTMPSKQTFKCNVYKNGELVGQTNG